MRRTITTCFVSLLVGILCGMFIYLDLSIDAIAAVINSADAYTESLVLAASLFEGTITPYSSYLDARYAPIAVLAITGFISGLVSKSATRTLVAMIIFLGIFFMGYIVLNEIVTLEFEMIKQIASEMTWDLAFSFFILFVSGIIGAAFTEEEFVV